MLPLEGGVRAVPVSVATFTRVALEDDNDTWELRCGKLVRKPAMTMEHNEESSEIVRQLHVQLDPDSFSVRMNSGHMVFGTDYYVPDVAVIPVEYLMSRRGQPRELEAYREPLPFVVEVWSRSTGGHDVDAKLPVYRQRGDIEIWRVHPYERTVTAWRRQPDGTYTETALAVGRVALHGLPGVVIDLERVFRFV
jgi:Uma2 family endonuclease